MNRKLYIQATPEQELLFCFSEMEILSPNNCGDFWQLWLSYQDVAKQLTISEDNVRKRILEARKILQKQLKKYLAGEDNTRIDFLSPALKKDISMEEKWQSDETLRQAQCGAVICDWESLIPTNSKQEEINYKVTLICLETLPPHWYSSPNSLGWN